MAFDIQGAKKAGYSESEIADYLGQENKFDLQGARKAGYSDTEIIAELSAKPTFRGTAPGGRDPFAVSPKETEAMRSRFLAQETGKPYMTAMHTAAPVQPKPQTYLQRLADPENLKAYAKTIEPIARPTISMLGAAGGGALGFASPVPGGTLIGETLGYGGGQQAGDILFGEREPVAPGEGQTMQTLRDIYEGGKGALLGLGAGLTLGQAPKVARAIGDYGAGLLGTTTGTGKEYIKQALKGGQAFKQAMRAPEGEKVVSAAKNALNVLKEERGAAYRSQLEDVAKNIDELDITPIKGQWEQIKGKFGIRTVDGAIDLSRSTLSRKEQGDINEIADMLEGWGQEPGDLTPMGLDLLKRKLDNLYTESKDSRAIVANLRSMVKNTIVKSVPEYAEMTKGYEDATKTINELDRTLSLGKKPMLDTTLRKLQQSMRDNFQFRKELLDTLEAKSGEELADMIAGYSMSSFAPQGGFGKLTLGAGGVGLTQSFAPGYLALMASSSPRAVGETLHALGVTGKQFTKLTAKINKMRPLVEKSLKQQRGNITREAMRQTKED